MNLEQSTHKAYTAAFGGSFDVNQELRRHSWYPHIGSEEAEKLLAGNPAYTYLTRPNQAGRGFMVSFVREDGSIFHDHFSIIDPKLGIWRNSSPHHVGTLAKVIRDMMHCSMDAGQPL